MMRRRQQRKHIPKPQPKKLSNLDIVVQDIRSTLGLDWGFYQEFLEGVKDAITRGQDCSAWIEHIEPLVVGREDLYLAHQGVLFLLGEVRVKARSEGRMACISSRLLVVCALFVH